MAPGRGRIPTRHLRGGDELDGIGWAAAVRRARARTEADPPFLKVGVRRIDRTDAAVAKLDGRRLQRLEARGARSIGAIREIGDVERDGRWHRLPALHHL